MKGRSNGAVGITDGAVDRRGRVMGVGCQGGKECGVGVKGVVVASSGGVAVAGVART